MANAVPVALVTGGGRGLGRGIACRLSALGLSVGVNYAGNQAAAEETVELCKQVQTNPGQRFIALRGDVGSREDRQLLVSKTLEELGRIDALVNNAGIAPRVRNDVTQMTVESFEEVMRVNLEGPFFLTQLVANYWLNERPEPALPRGYTIVFNSSMSASTVSLNRGEYCMSKAGLSMAMQLWAVRLAAEGIRVYEIRPGIMATDMTKGVKERYDRLMAEGTVPMKRWGTPEDVGSAVGALVTGEFPYSTGEIVYVDGGFHLSRL